MWGFCLGWSVTLLCPKVSRTGIKASLVDLMKLVAGVFFRDKRCIQETFNAHSSIFKHLQAFKQEQTGLNVERLCSSSNLILSSLYLLEQMPHSFPLKRCISCEQLVQDAAKRPGVYFFIVPLAHQYLRRLVKWSSSYFKFCHIIVEDCWEPEIWNFHTEGLRSQVDSLQKLQLQFHAQLVKLLAVWKVK